MRFLWGAAMESKLKSTTVEIPERKFLVETDEADPLKFYYIPGVRYFYVKRFEMVVADLMSSRVGRLLDVGFGSGVLLPSVSRLADSVYGVDMHEKVQDVRRLLESSGVSAFLVQGSALEIPFVTGSFDTLVSVSVLEHIKEVGSAAGEVSRVLKSSGRAVIGFPVKNILTTAAIGMLGMNLSTTVDERHPSSHTDILAALRRSFAEVSIRWFPAFVPLDLSLYCVASCKK